MASCVLGVLGGALNIGVGVYCLKQAYQARKDLSEESKKILEEKGLLKSAWLVLRGKAPEDLEKYIRLGWDGILLIAIGAFMVLVSLAIKVGALAGLGSFLAANPWILPLLWFLTTIPLFMEVAKMNKNIFLNKDLASQLQLKRLRELLESKEGVNWAAVQELYAAEDNPFNFDSAKKQFERADFERYLSSMEEKSMEAFKKAFKERFAIDGDVDFSDLDTILGSEEQKNYLIDCIRAEKVSEKMQALQVNIGPEAAIEAMKLKQMLMEKDASAALDQIKTLEGKIGSWNRAQKWRLLQQVLLLGSFILSMVGLIPKVNPKTINIATNAVIGLGNFIPLVMDLAWPFKRNVYMVVPKAEASDVMKRVDGVAHSSMPSFSDMLAREDHPHIHEVDRGIPTFADMLATQSGMTPPTHSTGSHVPDFSGMLAAQSQVVFSDAI